MAKKRKYFKDEEPLFIDDKYIFYNEKPISFDHTNLNLKGSIFFSEFPLISDFDIIYRYDKNKIKFVFFSEKHGFIGFFPYGFIEGANVEEVTTLKIPLGTMDKPYFDAGQGSAIYIFERYNHIYIMNSHGDDINIFQTWYKVVKEQYFAIWEDTINGFKSRS